MKCEKCKREIRYSAGDHPAYWKYGLIEKRGVVRHRICPKRLRKRGKKKRVRGPHKMHFRVDGAITAIRHLNGTYRDKRSFLSLDNHEILYGSDKSRRRDEIFRRANGACEIGFKGVCTEVPTQWAHIGLGRHRNHCDCLEAGAAACVPCHIAFDGSRFPRWTPREAREKESM